MSIAENVAAIRARIDAAAQGRRVLLVAASKMNDAAAVREAIAAGVDACGENRVQELLEKNAQGAYAGAPLHFIGHLQKNKVKYLVGTADLIESVDSVELLRMIDARARKLGVTQDVLLEVNIGGEESKSGFLPKELRDGAAAVRELDRLRVLGLMAIPPVEREPHGNLPYFVEVSRLYVDISRSLYHNSFVYLSMGMSDDFEDAIAAGATMVRVGSAIFGRRHYQ